MAASPPDNVQWQHETSVLDRSSVQLFPSSDRAFRSAVAQALAQMEPGEGLPITELAEMLRQGGYPRVHVVEQAAFAAVGTRRSIYVFRDGSVSAQPGDGPGTPQYVSLLVAIQRACARNLATRNRSTMVMAGAISAVEKSRSRRAARGQVVADTSA